MARPRAWINSQRLRPAISAPLPCETRPRLYRWIAATRRISRPRSSGLSPRSSKRQSGTWTVMVIVSLLPHMSLSGRDGCQHADPMNSIPESHRPDQPPFRPQAPESEGQSRSRGDSREEDDRRCLNLGLRPKVADQTHLAKLTSSYACGRGPRSARVARHSAARRLPWPSRSRALRCFRSSHRFWLAGPRNHRLAGRRRCRRGDGRRRRAIAMP